MQEGGGFSLVWVSPAFFSDVSAERQKGSPFKTLPQQGLGIRGRESTYAVIYVQVMLLSLTMTRLWTKLHEVLGFFIDRQL